MSQDRRRAPRLHADLLFNEYIDGYPHLCRTLNVSETGLLLERLSGPAVSREFYPVEIGVVARQGDEEMPERLWLWAREIWSDGKQQALKFVGVETRDIQRLRAILNRSGCYATAVA